MELKRLRTLLCLILAFFIAPNVSAQNEVVKWKASAEHNGAEDFTIRVEAAIDPGWHLYDLGPYEGGPNETEITFELPQGVTLNGSVVEPQKPQKKFDDLFEMNIGWYTGKAVFLQKVRSAVPEAVIKVNIEWMVCDDKQCLPPDDIDLRVKLPVVSNAAAHAVIPDEPGTAGEDEKGEAEGAAGEPEDQLTASVPVTDEGSLSPVPAAAGLTIWDIILAAMKWALLAIISPCVFPMIPMTVSFFLKSGGTPLQGRFKAFMYGLFIVLLYTLPIAVIILITRSIGGEAVTNDIFNWLATHWIPNVIFFLVFMTFAASFFGAFEITLPSRFVNKSDKNSDRAGLAGVFFMSLTLVLVSFSCTGPLVGSALAEATTLGGSFWTPIVTMLAFSVIFAIPFVLCAFFPALLNKMPKSGGWLNSVKVVLGFIEVALGLKFLSVADQTYHWGILDREVYLAIWIVVFSLMGAYLLGKIKFKHDSEVKYIGVGRLALVIATFSFVVYLIPGMFGAPLKALSGYMPPMHTQDFVLGSGTGVAPQSSNSIDAGSPKYSDFLKLPHGLTGFFDLDEAQAYADKVGKPLFVDITGHGCVNCREMEARVWSDPQVLSLLRNDYVVVAVYVDDKKTLPESEWITTDNGKVLKGLGKINSYTVFKKYGVNAQPYYILQGLGGQVLSPPRGYDLSVPGFIEFLKEGVVKYRQTMP